MRNVSILFCVFLTVTVISITGTTADPEIPDEENEQDAVELREKEQLKKQVEANVRKFQEAKRPRDAGAASVELFEDDRVDLEQLMTHKDQNVAIHAAWHGYMRQTFPRRIEHRLEYERFDPRDLQRFFGFVEGRGHVLVPLWWEEAIADIYGYDEPESSSRHDGGWIQLDDIVKRRTDEHVVLELFTEFSDEVLIPIRTFESFRGGKVGIGVEEEKYASLLYYSNQGFSTTLACVDMKNVREMWRTKVWGISEVIPTSGAWSKTFMSMDIINDRVFVFLFATRRGASMEAFDVKDGTPLIRFATTNWYAEKKKADATNPIED